MSNNNKLSRDEVNKFFQEKDKLFEKYKADDNFPYQTCVECKTMSACCKRHWHHRGDNCIHCGNDERND
jgi:hypothetical protein